MKKSVLILIVLLSVSAAFANVEKVYPTDDTYTSGSGGCFGASTSIITGNFAAEGHDERGMLLFDLDWLTGQTIQNATLFIKRSSGCGLHLSDTDFLNAAETWDESYDGGHVACDTTVWANVVFNANKWWEIDLTDLVQAWLNGDIPNYGVVMAPNDGSGDAVFYSHDAPMVDAPYLAIDFGDDPTPSPTPEVTPTATPSLPEITCPVIKMSQDYFEPGDSCSCTVTVYNMEDHDLINHPLFVMLDVMGYYFFAPSFGEYDSYLDAHPDFPMGATDIEVLPAFDWPENAGSADDIVWYAALTDPGITKLVGDFDTFTFGWGE